MLARGVNRVVRYRNVSCAFYSTKSLNVVFFGSDAVSNPTLQLLFSDYLREDGLINKLEVLNCFPFCLSNRLYVLPIRKISTAMS